MIKKLLSLVLASFTFVSVFAQEQNCKFTTEGYLKSREVYRGVGIGYAPAAGASVSYQVSDAFSLKSSGMAAVNLGPGYNSWLENGVTYTRKNLSAGLNDVFFFNGDGAVGNDYFDLGENTRHLVNATVKYSEKKFYGLVQATVYKASADENNGIYFEAGCTLKKCLNISAGYVTDASTLNFRTDAGITHISVGTSKEIKISSNFTPKVTTLLSFNPSYKNVSEGVSNTPVQMSLGLVF